MPVAEPADDLGLARPGDEEHGGGRGDPGERSHGRSWVWVAGTGPCADSRAIIPHNGETRKALAPDRGQSILWARVSSISCPSHCR